VIHRSSKKPLVAVTQGLAVFALVWAMSLIGGGILSSIQQRLSDRPLSVSSATKPKPQDFEKVQNVPTGHFAYGGSAAWASIRLIADSAIQAERLEFQLRYVQPQNAPVGSSTGLSMLLQDRLAFAQTARPVLPAETQQAQSKGFQLKQIPVAIDGIAVAVHPTLNLPGLTIDQLRSIYTGQVTNWRQLGGADLEIRPLSSPMSTGGTVEFFLEDILQGQTFSNKVQYISTPTEALRYLTKTPGGIYFSSAAIVVPQCSVKPLPLGKTTGQWVSPYAGELVNEQDCPMRRNRLNVAALRSGQYPLGRFLYVVVKQNGRIEEQAGDAYSNFLLSAQGQILVEQAGLVPIR
jgi:phosphate transport system substrate-binding protein